MIYVDRVLLSGVTEAEEPPNEYHNEEHYFRRAQCPTGTHSPSARQQEQEGHDVKAGNSFKALSMEDNEDQDEDGTPSRIEFCVHQMLRLFKAAASRGERTGDQDEHEE